MARLPTGVIFIRWKHSVLLVCKVVLVHWVTVVLIWAANKIRISKSHDTAAAIVEVLLLLHLVVILTRSVGMMPNEPVACCSLRRKPVAHIVVVVEITIALLTAGPGPHELRLILHTVISHTSVSVIVHCIGSSVARNHCIGLLEAIEVIKHGLLLLLLLLVSKAWVLR